MELEKEGIDALEIRFTDNKPVLNLYLTRPIGLLSLLDEQCRGFNVCTLKLVVKRIPYLWARADRSYSLSVYSWNPARDIHDPKGWCFSYQKFVSACCIVFNLSSAVELCQSIFLHQAISYMILYREQRWHLFSGLKRVLDDTQTITHTREMLSSSPSSTMLERYNTIMLSSLDIRLHSAI